MAETGESGRSAKAQGRAGRRSRLLRVRVHADELECWRAAARRQRVHNLSAWLRASADQASVCGEDPLGWRHDLAVFLRRANAVYEHLEQVVTADPAGTGCCDEATIERLREDMAAIRQGLRAHLLRRPLPHLRRSKAPAAPDGTP